MNGFQQFAGELLKTQQEMMCGEKKRAALQPVFITPK